MKFKIPNFDNKSVLFNEEECNQIISYSLTSTQFDKKNPSPGKNQLFDWYFVFPNEENQWMFDKVHSHFEKIVDTKIIRPIKRVCLMKYDVDGVFFKHNDSYLNNEMYTMVTLLNDEYVGGELTFEDPDYQLEKGVGSSIVFHSSRFHEVKKITDGVRWSMVSFFFVKDLELKYKNKLL